MGLVRLSTMQQGLRYGTTWFCNLGRGKVYLVEKVCILQILHGLLQHRQGLVEEEGKCNVSQILPQGLLEDRPHE